MSDAAGLTRRQALTDRRMPALDGLRSLVVAVMLVHFTHDVHWAGLGGGVIAGTTFVAMMGLDMFFVLSGFLITGILLDTKGSGHYFRTFYARRALRILPLYYGALLGYLVVLPLLSHRFEPLHLDPLQHAYYWTYLVNVALVLHWHLAPYTDHLWSLAVEEQFYLAWPVMVFFCTRRQLRNVCIACMVVSPLLRFALAVLWPHEFTARLTPARLDGLAFGALLALMLRSEDGLDPVIRGRWKLLAATIAVIGLAFWGFAAVPGVEDGVILTSGPYLGAFLILSTLADNPDGLWLRLVGSRALRRIGTYSYGAYVLHAPLAYCLERLGWIPEPTTLDNAGYVAFYCLLMVVVSLLAAALSWHAFEAPVLRFKRHFAYAASPESSRAADADEIAAARVRLDQPL